MNRDRFLKLSLVEAQELKGLVNAELARRFGAIREKLESKYAVVVGYEPDEAWSEVRELVDELVKSNLAALNKSLAVVLGVPPAKAPIVKAPEEPEPEPEPAEPAEPEPEPETPPAAEPEVEPGEPEVKPGARRSRT